MTWRKNVLKNIKPSKEEEKELLALAEQVMKKIKLKNVTCELGGSSAKGTWLKGNHDIDIYVKFNQKTYAGMDISSILKRKLKKAKVLHGSRDYFQIEKDGYQIELIPIMHIKKVQDADNITDISPFHKKWVRKHRKLTDDIRLAKAFAKANNIYGAESYIKGFSGYAVEVLTIHYGSFENLLKNVSKWKRKTVLDPKGWHKGKVELNKSKMVSPLIVVDPVQATRNVTAVVSQEKYSLFKKVAKDFLKKPSDLFFVKEEFSLERLKKEKQGRLFYLEINPLDGKRDVVGAKLLKSFEFIKKELEEKEFIVNDAGWHWEDKAILWFTIDKKKLSSKVRHYGPPMVSKDRLKNFKKKWKGKKVKEENGFSYIVKEREFIDPEAFLSHLIEHDYVTSRTDSIENLIHIK